MVRLAGFEPTTPWFVAKYSIQLSYSRLKRSEPLSNVIRACEYNAFQTTLTRNGDALAHQSGAACARYLSLRLSFLYFNKGPRKNS